jgi:hypothetical protein
VLVKEMGRGGGSGAAAWECRVGSIRIKYIALKSCFEYVKILSQVKCNPKG